jgi:hypothetical protein
MICGLDMVEGETSKNTISAFKRVPLHEGEMLSSSRPLSGCLTQGLLHQA